MQQNNIESKWIEKIRKSDSSAFENLVDKYYEHLYKFAWRYVKDARITRKEWKGTLEGRICFGPYESPIH